jgi:hypothetical protein
MSARFKSRGAKTEQGLLINQFVRLVGNRSVTSRGFNPIRHSGETSHLLARKVPRLGILDLPLADPLIENG